MLTQKQKLLIRCLKASEMGEDEVVGTMLFLKSEEMQDEMLEWMKSHSTASPDEVLRNVWRMKGFI